MNNLFGEDNQDNKEQNQKSNQKNQPEPEDFESAVDELEQKVMELESGNLKLEDTIDVYHRAKFLASWCYTKLNAIQGELKKLGLDKDGKFHLEDLDEID